MSPTSAHRLALWFALGASAALAACGGGGDAAAPSAAAPAPAPAPAGSPPAAPPPAASPAPPAPATTAGTRTTCNLANFQAEMLQAVNAHRRAGASCGTRGSFPAAPELAWNDPLTQAAIVHSDDMVARNFFSHTGSDGRSAGDRATAAGYVWRTWGENIAAGQGSVAQVVGGWMGSDGHCANIMNASFRDIGVACVAGNASTSYRTYWTMVLGATR